MLPKNLCPSLCTSLHLAVALAALLTLTPAGVAAAALALGVLALRHLARSRMAGPGSLAVGAGVLTAPEHAHALDAPGGPGGQLAA